MELLEYIAIVAVVSVVGVVVADAVCCTLEQSSKLALVINDKIYTHIINIVPKTVG